MNRTDNSGGDNGGEDRGQGTGDRLEAAVLPAPSPRGLLHRGAGRWGSLAGMDGNSIRGERGGVRPRVSGDGRPPTMVGRPHVGD